MLQVGSNSWKSHLLFLVIWRIVLLINGYIDYLITYQWILLIIWIMMIYTIITRINIYNDFL